MIAFRSQNLAVLVTASVFFAGCSSRVVPSGTPQAARLSGNLHGGQQPVAGASVQIYDIWLNVPLMSSPVTSDQYGNFSVTGQYTCPGSSDQIVLVATGGDSGSGVNNDLVLMTALGNCGSLSSATSVTINEVSTIATVYAYHPFLDPAASFFGYIGFGLPSNYTHFLNLVDPATGLAQPTADSSGGAKLNALANSLSVCINAPSVSGVTQQCNDLVTMSAAPSGNGWPINPVTAVYLIADNLAYAPASIFNLAPSNGPFQPTLSSAPSDWTLN